MTSTWIGPAGSNWNTAANWSPSGVPNNGVNDYNVIIGTPSPALLDISPAIDSLTVNASAQLTINSGKVLTVFGPTVTNNGLILVDTLNTNAAFNISANTLLTGTGTLLLNDYNPNARLIGGSGVTLTQDTGSKIGGVGEIDLSLTNNGTVNANYSGHTLALQTSNMTNNGLFEATGGGTLSISNITITQGAGGQILAGTGGAVTLSGATVNGGTLNAVSGSQVTLTACTLTNETIATGSLVVMTAGTTVNVSGGSLVDNGVIQVDTYSQNANLNFTADTTISGTGNIFLNDNSPHPTLNGSAGVTVTQSAGHTIRGTGNVNAALINNGVVNANFGGQSLILQTSPMTNNNLFEATGGGTLSINGITVTQSAGAQIVADNTSAVSIYGGATIVGGTINVVAGAAVTTSGATFNNVTITPGTKVVVASATTLNVSGNTLTNNGLIQVDTFSQNAALNFTSTGTIAGNGVIFLDDYNPNARLTSSAGVTVTQAAGHTINGVGEIDAALVNNGVVNANFPGRSIYLQTNAMTNNGLIEATAGANLTVTGTTVTQSVGGRFTANTSSSILITGGGAVIGGSINTSTGGSVTVSNGGIGDVTITPFTTVVVSPSTTCNVSGTTLTNNGLIQVDTFSGNAVLNFTTNSTVAGSGSIFLDSYGPNAKLTTAAGATVTVGPAQTVYGVGEIDASLVNNGVITARQNFGANPLYLQTNPMTNNGLIEAQGAGLLTISGIVVTQGANGRIAAASAPLTITNANIAGGSIGAGTGVVTVVKSTFNGVTVAGGAAVNVPSGTTFTLTGTNVNNGTYDFAGNVSAAGPLYGVGTTIVESGVTLTAPSIRQGVMFVNGTVTIPVLKPIAASTTVGQLGALLIGPAGMYDTGDADIDFTATPLGTVNTLVARAFNGPTGAWTGPGLTSTAARTDTARLTAIGVIQNNQGGSPIFTAANKFDGLVPAPNDVLVHYTYFGDANLDGKVDGSDYSLIDNGVLSHSTGWYNGDFNYDGVTDGSDYSLIDNAYNHQTTTLTPTAQLSSPPALVAASTAAVPEPATIGLAFGVALFVRRRRKA